MTLRFTSIMCATLLLLAFIHVRTTQAQSTENPVAQAAKKEVSYGRHSNSIVSVAFSPDGKRVASAGSDRIKLTDLTTGKEILKFKNTQKMNFLSVVYSPDGRWLAGGQTKLKERKTRREGDNIITTLIYVGLTIIWDANTGAVIATINDDDHPAWQLAVAPDGKTLAIGTGPTTPKDKDCTKELCEGYGEVLLVDTATWKIRSRLQGKAQPIRVLTFSPDGKRLAGSSGRMDWGLGNAEFEALIWDVETGRLSERLPRHARPILAMAFSADGKFLATSARDNSLRVWQLPSMKLLNTASEFVISANEIETITDKADKKKAKDALPKISWLTAVAFLPDSKTIIGCGADGMLRFYETSSGKITHVVKPRDWPIMSWDSFWAISDPSLFSSARLRMPGDLGFPSPLSPNVVMQFRGGLMHAMMLSPDGKLLAIGGADGKIRLMNLE
jgi:WD40 repeat protein